MFLFKRKVSPFIDTFFSGSVSILDSKNKDDYQIMILWSGDYTIGILVFNTGATWAEWQTEMKNKWVFVPLTNNDCKDIANAVNNFLQK